MTVAARSAEKAVVYDAATAGIARTFCGMFTVGTKASPERGGSRGDASPENIRLNQCGCLYPELAVKGRWHGVPEGLK